MVTITPTFDPNQKPGFTKNKNPLSGALLQGGVFDDTATDISPPFTHTPITPGAESNVPARTTQTVPVTDVVGDLVNQPSLPAGTEVVPELLEAQEDEFLQPAPTLDTDLQATTPTVAAPTTETQFDVGSAVSDISAPQLDVDAQTAEALDPNQQQAAQFEASLLTPDQIQSALVSTELSKLLDFEAGDVPKEFKGAVLAATAAANARGLGSSSMAAEAIAAGLVNAALPIAQGNSQVRLNSMLSNQAAENVAKQFNATSKNQVRQFYDSLKTQIDQFNATETNRINLQTSLSQAQIDMNTQITNAQNDLAAATTEAELSAASERLQSQLALQASVESAQLAAQISQFNTGLSDARERFNIDNQLIIDQSNTQWRRAINTENTAAINAANQTNAANLLSLSNFALSALWQQFRDEAFWAWTSGENTADRANNLAVAAFNRDTLFDQIDNQQESELFRQLGQFALNMIGNIEF